MKAARSIGVHAGLLAVAAATATWAWTRDRTERPVSPTEVTLWSASADAVERITWEAKTRKVVLEGKTDPYGRWFQGTVERDASGGDAGAQAKSTAVFVSVTSAGKLAETLAQPKAVRSLGRMEGSRAEEFGLASPEGKLTVRVGGVEHELVVGGQAPGGSDRYVLDPARGEAFAIKAEPVRDLEAAESRLLERDLHGWKENDVVSAKIVAGGRAREVVRGGYGAKRFWADPASRDKNDETLGNWMQKLDRVRINDYVAAPPADRVTVLRIEYTGASGPLGFVELAKSKTEAGKDEWYETSERARLWGKVTSSLAEQVAADLDGVVK